MREELHRLQTHHPPAERARLSVLSGRGVPPPLPNAGPPPGGVLLLHSSRVPAQRTARLPNGGSPRGARDFGHVDVRHPTSGSSAAHASSSPSRSGSKSTGVYPHGAMLAATSDSGAPTHSGGERVGGALPDRELDESSEQANRTITHRQGAHARTPPKDSLRTINSEGPHLHRIDPRASLATCMIPLCTFGSATKER